MPRDHPQFNPLFQAPPGEPLPLNDLERRALTLRAQGYKSPEIAEQLGYSRGWIENVLMSASQKLGGHTITETVVIALRTRQISWLARQPDL